MTLNLTKDLLLDTTLSLAGRFDIASISQEYTHLELYFYLRTNEATLTDVAHMFINGDFTLTNYFYQQWRLHNGTGAPSDGQEPRIILVPGSSVVDTEVFSVGFAHILNYTVSGNYKSAMGESSYRLNATEMQLTQHYMINIVAGAINRLTIQPDGYPTNTFDVGSRIQLVGVK